MRACWLAPISAPIFANINSSPFLDWTRKGCPSHALQPSSPFSPGRPNVSALWGATQQPGVVSWSPSARGARWGCCWRGRRRQTGRTPCDTTNAAAAMHLAISYLHGGVNADGCRRQPAPAWISCGAAPTPATLQWLLQGRDVRHNSLGPSQLLFRTGQPRKHVVRRRRGYLHRVPWLL